MRIERPLVPILQHKEPGFCHQCTHQKKRPMVYYNCKRKCFYSYHSQTNARKYILEWKKVTVSPIKHRSTKIGRNVLNCMCDSQYIRKCFYSYHSQTNARKYILEWKKVTVSPIKHRSTKIGWNVLNCMGDSQYI